MTNKPVEFVNGAKLTRAQKEAICGGNAAKLLRLKTRWARLPARCAGDTMTPRIVILGKPGKARSRIHFTFVTGFESHLFRLCA
jgi:hypothetical protein